MKKRLHSLDVWENDRYKQYTEVAKSEQTTSEQESSATVVTRKRSKDVNKGGSGTEHDASGRVEIRSVTVKNVQIKHLNDINKKDEESDEVYYKRILQQHSDETNDEYEERIKIMKERLSHLEIWKNNVYRNYQNSESTSTTTTTTTTTATTTTSSSQNLRHTEDIDKHESEPEQDYYARILKKHSDESDEEYSERLQVMMTKLSHLPIWKNNEYVKYQETKHYSESGSSVNEVTYTEVIKEENHEEHTETHG